MDYSFGSSEAQRIVSAVKTAESNPPSLVGTPARGRSISAAQSNVLVTSLTMSTYGYPAKIQYTADGVTYTDGPTCWFSDPNGTVPLAKRYLCLMVNVAADGLAIFQATVPPVPTPFSPVYTMGAFTGYPLSIASGSTSLTKISTFSVTLPNSGYYLINFSPEYNYNVGTGSPADVNIAFSIYDSVPNQISNIWSASYVFPGAGTPIPSVVQPFYQFLYRNTGGSNGIFVYYSSFLIGTGSSLNILSGSYIEAIRIA